VAARNLSGRDLVRFTPKQILRSAEVPEADITYGRQGPAPALSVSTGLRDCTSAISVVCRPLPCRSPSRRMAANRGCHRTGGGLASPEFQKLQDGVAVLALASSPFHWAFIQTAPDEEEWRS
jgi:hypothetical protein